MQNTVRCPDLVLVPPELMLALPARENELRTYADLSIAFPKRFVKSGFVIERPARGLKTKNLQTPTKRRMKAFNRSRTAHAEQAGLILLFDGEVDPAKRNHDEHSQTGILTSG